MSFCVIATLTTKKHNAVDRLPLAIRLLPEREQGGGGLLAKKKTARSIEFDDDLEDDDDSDDGATNGSTRRLSDTPRRRRKISVTRKSPIKPSQQKQYSGWRIFSDEEMRAIKEGMRQGLTGKWAEIKDMYSVILADRTSVQIKVSNVWNAHAINGERSFNLTPIPFVVSKDCVRTAKRRNELNDIEETSGVHNRSTNEDGWYASKPTEAVAGAQT
jgi:hypothetical protein